MGANTVRGQDMAGFVSTVKGLDPTSPVAKQAFELYATKKWPELEALFKQHNLNEGWPPNRGFISIKDGELPVGATFDRFGGYIDKNTNQFTDKGTFVAPYGSDYTGRALPAGTDSKAFKGYEVLKPIPMKEGPAIPWFGEKGNGMQYELEKGIQELIDGGYIKEITAPDLNAMKDKGTTSTVSTTKTPETTTTDGGKTETTGKETMPNVDDVLDTPEFETGDPTTTNDGGQNQNGSANDVGSALDGFRFDPDPTKNSRIRQKMLDTIANSGADGAKLAQTIIDGRFNHIRGYVDTIKKASVDQQSIKAINQAFDRADALIANGTDPSRLVFEDNPQSGDYDIDLGVIDTSGANTYSEAYQFKAVDNLKGVDNSLNKAISQVTAAPAGNRVVEFQVQNGTRQDLEANTRLVDVIQKKLQRDPKPIDEIRIKFANGEEVVYK